MQVTVCRIYVWVYGWKSLWHLDDCAAFGGRKSWRRVCEFEQEFVAFVRGVLIRTRIFLGVGFLTPVPVFGTVWRRLIGSPKLQIIFHKRATKYRSLLRKMTYKNKGSYQSPPPCTISSELIDIVDWVENDNFLVVEFVKFRFFNKVCDVHSMRNQTCSWKCHEQEQRSFPNNVQSLHQLNLINLIIFTCPSRTIWFVIFTYPWHLHDHEPYGSYTHIHTHMHTHTHTHTHIHTHTHTRTCRN